MMENVAAVILCRQVLNLNRCNNSMNCPHSNEVHFWTIDDFPIEASLTAVLNQEERQRYARITAPRIKRQFLQTRLALRHILSHYHGQLAPSHWQFSRNDYGRPALVGDDFEHGLVFNISHTRGALVIGFARAGDLGVDVEYTQRQARAIALADRYFSPDEVAQLQRLEPSLQKPQFFDLWTLKEAYIKACGMGLALSLASFSYRFSEKGIDVGFAAGREDDAARWEFWQVQLSSVHQAAIAYGSIAPAKASRLQGFRLCAWNEVQAQELELIRCSERLVQDEL